MRSYRLEIVLALIVLLSLTIGGIWSTAAQETQPLEAEPASGSPGEFSAGEVLVKFKGDASISSVQSALVRTDATRVRTLYRSNVQLWQVPEGRELEVVEELKADPAVEYAEPNYVYHAYESGSNTPNVVPDDPFFSYQWAHLQIQSPPAWDITTGGAGVVIAIIDSGVDLGHPDLADNLVTGVDLVDSDSAPWDQHGHGTHVAGVAAAIGNNGIGIAGVSWQAKIMPVRVLDRQGLGPSDVIAEGIRWAYEHGADVLNLSLGGSVYSQTMKDAVTEAHEAGTLVIAAMGNDRMEGNPVQYPAAYPYVMAVAATGPTDVYAPYSQYGSHCDISAPGGDMDYLHDPNGIFSTMPTYPVYVTTNQGHSQNYDYASGTSQAAPHVAGLAALVWALQPTLSSGEVQTIIQSTADDLGKTGWDETYGYGRINAQAALQTAAPPTAPTLLPIQNTDGDGTYSVNWEAVTAATGYTLQEADNPSFVSPSKWSVGSNTRYEVTGKLPGTTWYYRVMATNSKGESPWSNVESVKVAPDVPDLDPILNATQEDEYLVSWSAENGATSYTLGESTNPSCSEPTTRYMGPAVRYDVTGQRGGTWYYCVNASNAGADSAWSSVVSTTVATPALKPPRMRSIANDDGDGDYVVRWREVPTTPITYTLEESSSPYFVSPMVVYRGTKLRYDVQNQPPGTWHYRVRAFGADGKSPWSDSSSATVLGTVFLPLMTGNHSTTVSPPFDGWQTIVSEDFEGTFPKILWDVFDNDIDSFLFGEYYWGQRDCRPYTDSNYSAWAVGDGWDGGTLDCYSPYPHHANSWMVYGPFSLEDATNAELTYKAWVNVDSADDKLCHSVSIDNQWFYGYCATAAFPQQVWTERVFNLTNVPTLGDLSGEPRVYLLLSFESDLLGSTAEGVYVDDILLRKYIGTGTTLAGGQQPSLTAGWEEPTALTRTR